MRYVLTLKPLILASLALLAVAGCTAYAKLDAQPAPEAGQPGLIEIYFTQPGALSESNLHGGPDEALVAAIDQAHFSVDVAAYDLNLWSVRDALEAAYRRGVRVRLVTDSDNLEGAEIKGMRKGGIAVRGDRREGLMHNKFVVIDGLQVWTGSMNLTTHDAYANDNNLLSLRSTILAEDYTCEFEEMFLDGLFGPDTRADTPHPQLDAGGILLDVYFSPDDGTAAHLIQSIRHARSSIYFLAFSFTSGELAEALIERARSGVIVAGVIDESQVLSYSGTEYERFSSNGIQALLDGNPRLMHHKVMVIDEEIVVVGSYNFSRSAETRNDENTLVIHDRNTARLFMEEFWRIYDQAAEASREIEE